MKFFTLATISAFSASASRTSANPIRKVVKLLDNLHDKVQKEGEKEKELFEKFQCYCKNSGSDLEASIAAANQAGPQLSSEIEAAISAKSQLDEELVQHKADRKAAKAAISKANKIRDEEKAEYDKVTSEYSADISALKGAVESLEKGVGSGFLQTSTGSVLRKLANTVNMASYDRTELVSFLSTNNAPSGGTNEIIGILKQMFEDMDKDLGGVFSREEAAVKAFNGMVAAKRKEIAAHSSAIESKTARSGELAVEIANKKNDAEQTADALAEDQKFLASLAKGCQDKEAEWSERQKTRSEELAAIAETIQVLNDDDSLQLFNKTLKKNNSFLQVEDKSKSVRSRALESVADKFGFLQQALKGKKVGFDKIVKMIDEMVITLKQEQVDDEHHREYCLTEFDSADDKEKELVRNNDGLQTSIEDTEDAIGQLGTEIKALKKGIKELDENVAEATETRKEENAEFTSLIANNSTAKKVIEWAKNRLNKFYNPALHTTTTGAPLTEEERLFVANGGELSTTPAPAGIAGTGIGLPSFIQTNDAPVAPPATWDAYQTKGRESNGVISLMDLLIKELEKEIQEAEHDEKVAQRDYETLMQESASKREADTKAITEKSVAKADAESDLQAQKTSLKSGKSELHATREYIHNLHGECDFLLHNFDLRKEARGQEIDGLKNAKAVLAGADYN